MRAGIRFLCVVIALATAATAAMGIFMRGTGASRSVTSVRGEVYEMATDGVYAFNAQRVVAEGVGWDVLTLVVIVPALLVAVPLLRRNSFRARLFTLGLLLYLFYQYLMYAVTWSLGPLFLPFVVIYALSLVAIVQIAASFYGMDLRFAFTNDFPHRSMAVFSAIMGSLLVLMWLARIASATLGTPQGILLGQQTLGVQALDLGIVVPLSFLIAVLAWRRTVMGSILSAVFIIKSVGMCAAICGMLLSAWVVEGALEFVPFAIFLVALVVSLWLAVTMYRSTVHP